MAKDTKSGDSDSTATAATEGADKGSKLEQLLAEYNEKSSKQAAATKGDASKEELTQLKSEVEKLRAAEADRTYRKEMDENLIPTIKGDLDVHPKHVERWINEQANADPRLLKLWDERGEKPEAFKDAFDKLKTQFAADAKDEGLIGTGKSKNTRDGDGRFTAAVRGARTPSSATGDVSNVTSEQLASLPNHEFALKKAEILRAWTAGQLS